MKPPRIYQFADLFNYASNTQKEINGQWVPTRPLGYSSFVHRIKCAWLVFTGRGGVVIWPEGQ